MKNKSRSNLIRGLPQIRAIPLPEGWWENKIRGLLPDGGTTL
jgi:hypothetical protein